MEDTNQLTDLPEADNEASSRIEQIEEDIVTKLNDLVEYVQNIPDIYDIVKRAGHRNVDDFIRDILHEFTYDM